MNHFERAFSDSDRDLQELTTDIEYLLKISAKLQSLGRLSINSVHMIPYENAVQEASLTRGARVTPEVLGIVDSEDPDFMNALDNRTSPFGEEEILYGSIVENEQLSLFDIDDDDNGQIGRTIYRGDED